MLIRPRTNGGPIELHEWNGNAWSLVSTTGAPWTLQAPVYSFSYHALAYDQRRDKLVLFGRTTMTQAGTLVSIIPDMWEWDAASGWIQFSTNGPIERTAMWFDEHRGRLVRHEEYGTWPPPTAHFLDDNRI